MMDMNRIFNNMLFLGILIGIGYIIYMKIKGKGVRLDAFKGKLGGMVDKGNELRRGKI